MKLFQFIKQPKILALFLTGFFMLQYSITMEDFGALLKKKIETYREKYPMEKVYVQTDRDLYAPGNGLFFKAYVKDFYTTNPGSVSQNLHLLLIDSHGKKIREEIFQIENGQSAGKFNLDETFPEGKYVLIGFTDLMKNGDPGNVFSKSLFIKKIKIPNTLLKLTVPDTLFLPLQEAVVNLQLLLPNGKPTGKKPFSYMAKINGTPMSSGNGKTGKNGKAEIKFQLPDYMPGSLISVEVQSERANNTEKNSVILPTQGLPLTLEFFPESGDLVNGFETKIGFKTSDYFGNPLEIEGQIIDANNNVLGNFQSLTRGIGFFSIVADINNPCKIKITRPAGIDQTFILPRILPYGVNLVFKNKNRDYLSFEILSGLKEKSGDFHVTAELNGQIVWYDDFRGAGPFSFNIPVNELSQGTVRITLFNQQGLLLARRAVFLDKSNANITVSTDRVVYAPREEITINVRYQGSNGKPAPADLSMAVTDANLNPDWNVDPDIFSHLIMGGSAKNLHLTPGLFFNPSEKTYILLDALMLTLDDNKYDWAKVQQIGKNQLPPVRNEGFITKVLKQYQLKKYWNVVDKVEMDQFFYNYILKYDQVFPEYLLVNKRYLNITGLTMKKPSRNEQIQQDLASGVPILNVIMSIKPYQIKGNKIVFQGLNSFLHQDGALFVLDGVKLGTNVSVINSINPIDLESIEVFTNPVDMSRYTSLNTIGIIDMKSKRGLVESEPSDVQKLNTYNPTIYWNPYVNTPETGEMALSIESSSMKTRYNIIVQGVDISGRPVFSISQFSVY